MEMKTLVKIACCVVAATGSAHATGVENAVELETLWWIQNPTLNDSIYTINPKERDDYIACCGYQSKGSVALIPMTIGYPNFGHGYYVKAPFYQLWGDQPATAHFYTAIADHRQAVLDWGWQDVGTQGFLFGVSIPNSKPLWRMRYLNSITGDMEYRYTTKQTEIDSLMQAGWAKIVTEGYVYDELPSLPKQYAGALKDQSGSLWLTSPAFVTYDLFGSAIYACIGRVHFYTMDHYWGFANNFSYQTVPGTFNEKNCLQSTGIRLGSSVRIKLVYTGAAASLRQSNGTYGPTRLLPPSTRTFTLY